MTDQVPVLRITLGGDEGEFKAYAHPNQWALMQNAQALKENNSRSSAASTYNLAVTSVLPEERGRFNQWMMDHGHDQELEDKLSEALIALWDGQTLLPLEQASSDSSSSTGGNGSTSTDDSSEPESSRIAALINGHTLTTPETASSSIPA